MLRLKTKTRSVFSNLQTFSNIITEGSSNVIVKLETKIKGTFMENWVKYWKTLCRDYKDVAIDVYKDVKEKPLKGAVIGTVLSSLYYCAIHNPDEIHFRDTYLKAANDLLLVHPSLQKPEAVEHVAFIEKKFNSKQIKRLNLGIVSVIWTDINSDECNVYEAQCKYLQLEYSKFKSRIVDVGFLNNWWILSNVMIDYDINY